VLNLHQSVLNGIRVYGLYLQSCPTQVVVIVEVKNQSSVIQSPGAGVVSQVEGAGVEAGFEQLAARDGHGA